MYRVLILDDEPIILDTITYVIESSYDRIIVETARNGQEGLAKVDEFRPHIIFTDIKMPGIDGIEFIKRTRDVDSKVKIVIVTAYDQFEIAKASFPYQVEDYLLKPVNKGKICSLIDSLIAKLELEKNSRNRDIETLIKYQESVEIVQKNFFNELILKRVLPEKEHYERLIEIPLKKGSILMFHPQNTLSDPVKKSLFEDIKTQLTANFTAMVSDLYGGNFYAYVEIFDEGFTETEENFLNILVSRIGKRHQSSLSLAIGEVRRYENLLLSLESAEELGEDPGDEELEFFEEVTDLEALIELQDQVLDKLVKRDNTYHYLLKELERACSKALINSKYERIVRVYLIQTYGKAEQALTKTTDLKHLEQFSYLRGFNLLRYFITSMNQLYHGAKPYYHEQIEKSLSYLHDHYKEDITLEKLSEMVGVTRPYLSKLFKDNLGSTFKEYITALRIDSAKRRLLNTEESIAQIAYYVGYNDPNYFIRIFKKTTGMTPNTYKKVMK